jgi:hypothetical protein
VINQLQLCPDGPLIGCQAQAHHCRHVADN